MSTDMDTRLRAGLEERIGAVEVPLPDAPNLVGRGRRARRLRTGASLAGGVAVAAVVASVVSLLPSGEGPGNSPEKGRSTDLLPVATDGARGPEPVPGPTGLFVTKDKVYLGGKSYDVRLPRGTGAHVSAQGVAFPQPGSDRPMLLRLDGTVVPLGPEGPEYGGWVAADSSSGIVAWVEHHGAEAADIVAFDTVSMSEVTRKRLSCGLEGWSSGCPMPYVASNGVLFVTVDGGSIAWNTADDTSSDVFEGLPAQAHNRVMTGFEHEELPLGQALPDWEVADVPDGIEGILSYDGSWVLDANGDPTVVNWRDPDQTIRYRVPGTVVAATFDTDGSVLAVSHDDGRYTGWDCTLDGPCQQVVAPQAAEIQLVAWDL